METVQMFLRDAAKAEDALKIQLPQRVGQPRGKTPCEFGLCR
jgi:hypothetical protein